MTEREMWQALKRSASGYCAWVQRIESGGSGAGIPDVYWALARRSGWLELKVGTGGVRGPVRVHYRPGQIGWLRGHNQHCPTAGVLLLLRGVYYLVLDDFQEEYPDRETLRKGAVWSGNAMDGRFWGALTAG